MSARAGAGRVAGSGGGAPRILSAPRAPRHSHGLTVLHIAKELTSFAGGFGTGGSEEAGRRQARGVPARRRCGRLRGQAARWRSLQADPGFA